MTDVQAAIGREQLKRLPDIVARRRELASRYHKLIADVPGVKPPFEPVFAKSNWQSYSIRLPYWTDQRAIMQFMLDRGVATRRGIMCAHREPAYLAGQYRAAGSLAESEAAQDHSIILPLFHQMSSLQQDRVVKTLAESMRSAQMSGRVHPQVAH
jgi:perosamine synthetase